MPTPATIQRRSDLDWLRVISVFAVFVFHSGLFFNTMDWHIKNPHTYTSMLIVSFLLALWMMPLIFMISGASIYYALGARSVGDFIKERILRLLVPLVVGIFTHIALSVYLERLSHGQFAGTFFAFYPHYFDGLYWWGGNFAWMGLHLWYLEVLFVFSLVFLPWFWWLKRPLGRRILDRFHSLLAQPYAIYLLALPIMLLQIAFNPNTIWTGRSWGGWSLPAYIPFFLYGFFFAAHEQVKDSILHLRWLSLAGGITSILAMFVANQGSAEPTYGTINYVLVFALFGLAAWCLILAIWGFTLRHLAMRSPLLAYANEAVLPFYILHHTVLLCVGYFVVQSALPDLVKAILISGSTLLIITGLYEFLIRRSNLLRFLFGMKAQASQEQRAVLDAHQPQPDL
ncbi:MAG: acyltransferase family protein [Anaerolineae bacterium]|nr:acyltransferase family protein [Anaerolineae bacterium]